MPKTIKTEGPISISVASILEKVDPVQAAVMLLGGTASACGVVPPMTKLLEAINGNSAADTWHLVSTPGWKLIEEWLSGKPSSEGTLSEDEKTKMIGRFCSGAIEAAIMFEFVKSPDFKKAMLALPGQAIQGVGKLIP